MMTALIGEELRALLKAVEDMEPADHRSLLTVTGAVVSRSHEGLRQEAIDRWRRTTKARRLAL